MTYRSNLLPQLKEAQEGKRMNEVGSFALAHSLLELPEDDQFSDIRILRIRFLAHSDIRMYSNVDDSCIFGL